MTLPFSLKKHPMPILCAVSSTLWLILAQPIYVAAELTSPLVDWASSDHEAAAIAIVDGISQRASNEPGYYIHTSGTGVLCFGDMDRKSFGEPSTKVFDDWDGIKELTSLPDHAPHRPTDKVILAGPATNADKVKTAIVCPPTIYVSLTY